MTNEDRIKACIGRHPDWDDYRVSHSLSIPLGDVANARAGLPIAPMLEPSGSGIAGPGFISLDSVIRRYDIRAAILREVAALPEGKLIAEAELCTRAAGTDKNRFRRTVENNPDTFNPLRIKLKLDTGNEGKWYWGKAQDISAALQIRDL
jgi:hypothetical protein